MTKPEKVRVETRCTVMSMIVAVDKEYADGWARVMLAMSAEDARKLAGVVPMAEAAPIEVGSPEGLILEPGCAPLKGHQWAAIRAALHHLGADAANHGGEKSGAHPHVVALERLLVSHGMQAADAVPK